MMLRNRQSRKVQRLCVCVCVYIYIYIYIYIYGTGRQVEIRDGV